jgi:hypothetical protein
VKASAQLVHSVGPQFAHFGLLTYRMWWKQDCHLL